MILTCVNEQFLENLRNDDFHYYRKLLQAGASKNWQVILEETIGQNKMDASAILEYFAPLHKYLKEYRAEMNYPIGWSKDAFETMIHRD